ncbi:hypothetical protein [Thiococcus pfennigii]|uniref:hypothetical protein n=1 Tax=Thiococcus pfennigii TaxID=1057 RepID=UPI0019050FC0|nr:hypothetical protein [Thiococcus pfennigii]MBK1702488.1 hypothetical protein [Thiococcus pfennigii]MBK1733434.1 hypothetical protein [Thiococcus pfennigii]
MNHSPDRPRYDPELAALLQGNYGEAARAARNLAVSLRRTEGIFPLTGDAIAALDEGAKERIDAFRVRFADLQDLLVGKLFRDLLRLEEERIHSQLDIIHAMEKRGIVSSFEAWKGLRVIRNAFMHDDPEAPGERTEALNLAREGARQLLATLERLRAYAIDRIGLPARTLPRP